MEISYTLALTTGLLGGLGHCTGMCGPLVAAYTFHGVPSERHQSTISNRLLPHLLYNTGRITTYMFIGAIMGLTGSFINTAGSISGFQNAVAIIAGGLMILMGAGISGLAGGAAWLERHNNLILMIAKKILHTESLWRYYPLGALFGFLPCGLSYTVFMAAAGAGSLLSGVFITFFFGIGTLPSLLLFGVITGYMSNRLRGRVYKAAGVVIMFMGVYFLVRGINLYAKV